MEIKVTSIETIKPKLPTSDEYRTHQLCLFDVFQLNTYFPLILFYRKTNNMQEFSDVSTQLKTSLSEALTIFFPLCGRRSDCFFINCNDEGAIYMEASVNIDMEEFLTPPKLELLGKLLPCETNKPRPQQEILPQLIVQVNIFKCGGIAIGLCNLHTMLDACSCSAFLRTWSAICKGLRDEISQPDFTNASSLFPPRNTLGIRTGVMNINKGLEIEVKCTTRRFLFDTKAINDLKSMLENDGTFTKLTRYQVVSSFICKHMIVAYMKEPNDSTRQVVVLHMVDMRRRMGQPFSQDSIGNLIWPAVVLCENVNKNTSISDLVGVLKEAIGKLTKELFLKVQNDPCFLWSDECAKLMHEGIENKNPTLFLFTSWGNMGFKELNFGWGKPLWLAPKGGDKGIIPTVVLMETNEGIEAWVSMEEKQVFILENDMDFLKIALINPNVSTKISI